MPAGSLLPAAGELVDGRRCAASWRWRRRLRRPPPAAPPGRPVPGRAAVALQQPAEPAASLRAVQLRPDQHVVHRRRRTRRRAGRRSRCRRASFRGFNDPQADPSSGLVFVQTRTVSQVRPRRPLRPAAGLHGRRPPHRQPALGLAAGRRRRGRRRRGRAADTLADRHNQGAYSAIYNTDRPQRDQQLPNDAFGELSCPFPPLANPCDPYSVDCGGIALFDDTIRSAATRPDVRLPGRAARRARRTGP